jgi:hypothetical protein
MEDSISELLSPWREWPERLPRLLREVTGPAERAQALAEWLCRLVPPARFSRCRLEVERSCGDGSAADVVVAPLRWGNGEQGELVVGLPRGTAASERAAIGTLLGLAAQGLALHLEVEALRAEREECADFVTVGEAMIGLTHAVNNSLNTMVLQTATVQLRVSPELSEQLMAIRREGAAAAARLRPLQQLRHARQEGASSDLASSVRAALAEAPGVARRCAVELGAGLPRVAAFAGALRRVTTLLLRAGVSCLSSEKALLRVRTERDEQGVALVLEADGPFAGESPGQLTDLPLALFDGHDQLERVAAEAMVKRLDGRLALSKREDGGLTIRVVWPANKTGAAGE